MSTSRHLTGLRRFAKAAVAVCASLGLVLAAGGCGASSGESKTIYFWNNLVGDDGPAMQRIVKEYNAQSDYKVVFQPMNGGDLTTKIYSVMQTGKNMAAPIMICGCPVLGIKMMVGSDCIPITADNSFCLSVSTL